MDDLISRQAAIDALERAKQNIHHNIERAIGDAVCGILDEVENGIKQLPPIQPKRGRWEMGIDERSVECSECGLMTTRNELRGIAVFGKNEPNFCPNCGAKMEVTE